jgi:hypothetical protein
MQDRVMFAPFDDAALAGSSSSQRVDDGDADRCCGQHGFRLRVALALLEDLAQQMHGR